MKCNEKYCPNNRNGECKKMSFQSCTKENPTYDNAKKFWQNGNKSFKVASKNKEFKFF